MKYFKHVQTNEIYAFEEDGSQDYLIDEKFISCDKPENIISVPTAVTMRQARLALLQQGLLSQVQTAIDSLPSPHKEAAQIEWEYSSEVHRDKSFVQLLSAALGLSDEQLDDLLILAAGL